MAAIVYKWFLASFFLPLLHFSGVGNNPTRAISYPVNPGSHPYYISVVEINHNASEKTLEISCKIFTNDFETTLEKNYKTKVDLVNPPDKGAMDKIVNDYIKKHLSFKVDNKAVNFFYVGFEKQDEAIYSYFQVDNITSLKKIDIVNSILHDFSDQQINIIHCTVGGKRQSTKLDYPKTEASLEF
ncbi:MAG TPA: DUF6702 family protein [Chitinophagaceae bacterium]|nr:DUF6702 family protein [Chitinophagaceae bacterium]